MELDPRFFSKLPDGSIVEKDVLNVVEKINYLYGDAVKVMYLPPEAGPGITDPPYIICEWVPNLNSYQKIFDAWALDERILAKLKQLDTYGKNAAKLLEQLEKDERKYIDEANRKHKEWREEEAKPLVARAFKDSRAFTFKNEDGEIVRLHG